jgi:hypothetical protein
LDLAATVRAAIDASEEAQRSPRVARAAVVMLCGFLFYQRVDWIVPWTGYRRKDVRRAVANLVHAGIWLPDGSIAGRWCDVYFGGKRTSKRTRFEAEIAFWLDAMVALGELTRETRDGQFYYGLLECPALESFKR